MAELIVQPLFKFSGCKVKSLKVDIDPSVSKDTKYDDLEVKMDSSFVYDNEKEFTVSYDVTINDTGKLIDIYISIMANFITRDVITEEFKKSNFLKVNIPAIVFPYIRSYITTITVNSGINPIVLPLINFAKPSEKKEVKPEEGVGKKPKENKD